MLRPGQVIADRYQLIEAIGEGGMAAVWKAEDRTLMRQVAVKFLFVHASRDPEAMVDQFLREARIAASVQHRNVIQTVDFGTTDGHQPFMVMELLDGESLGDRMLRQPPLSAQALIHLMSLILRGLAAVHDAGIVHRDLKPHNIFLQRDGDAVYPKILDFGISRSLEQAQDRPSAIATQEGMIVGTPDYMAPEQARGRGDIDRRADIYGVGVMLYEALTGRLPFSADSVGDLIVKIITEEPPRPQALRPELPAALAEVIERAMSKDREHRYADARAMRQALMTAAQTALSAPAAGAEPLGSTMAAVAVPSAPGAAQRTREPAPTWGDFEGLASAAPGPPPPRDPVAETRGPAIPAPRVSAPAGAPPAASAPGGGLDTALELDLALGGPSVMGPAAGTTGPVTMSSTLGSGATDFGDLDGGLGDAGFGGGLSLELDAGPASSLPAAHGRRRRTGHVGTADHGPAASGRKTRIKKVPSGKLPGRGLGPWLLPIAAVVLIGYFMTRPKHRPIDRAPDLASPHSAMPTASGAAARATRSAAEGIGAIDYSVVAGSDLSRLQLRPKERRENPKKAPPHMRDVVF
ncbi:MAG: serine/threonine protein kinase [Myxococcales bacterium]|nr:serine/threonine protein kinase [Myxococcales bacterium]